jgi:hypothetical protein
LHAGTMCRCARRPDRRDRRAWLLAARRRSCVARLRHLQARPQPFAQLTAERLEGVSVSATTLLLVHVRDVGGNQVAGRFSFVSVSAALSTDPSFASAMATDASRWHWRSACAWRCQQPRARPSRFGGYRRTAPASREAGDGVGVLCVIVGGAPRPRLPLVVASRQEALEPATAELDLPQTAGVMIGVAATAQDRCAASFRRLVSDSTIVPSPIRSRTCSRASRPLKRTDELR